MDRDSHEVDKKQDQAFTALFSTGQRICFQKRVNVDPVFFTFPFNGEISEQFQFFVLNPFKSGINSRKADLVEYRCGFIIEMDCCSLELQQEWFKTILGHATVECFSGNKSIHHHVTFPAPIDAKVEEKLVDLLYKAFPFSDWKVIKNKASLCRTPGAVRDNGKIQEIEYVGEKRSFEEVLTQLENIGKDKNHPEIAHTFMECYRHGDYQNDTEVMTGKQDRKKTLPAFPAALADLRRCGYSLDEKSFEMRAIKEQEQLARLLPSALANMDTTEEKTIDNELTQIKPPRQFSQKGWRSQTIDVMRGQWERFYSHLGYTGFKRCGEWLKCFSPGGNHKRGPGFAFRPENGYFANFYDSSGGNPTMGFPQDYLQQYEHQTPEEAWKTLAEIAGVEAVDKCQYCEVVIEWKERIPYNPDGTQHKCKKQRAKKAKSSDSESRPKFNPIKEAKVFRKPGQFIFIWEQVRRYKEGWYQVEDDRVLLAQIAHQINEDFEGRLQKSQEVLETLKNLLAEECQGLKLPDIKYINCKNGILDLDTMKLLPHTPEMYFTNQTTANYDLDAWAKMQIWPQFLKDVLVKKDTQEPDDALCNVIQEFIGYCLYRGIPFHKAIMLYGGGNNGKSKLVGTVEKLFPDVTSHVHFEEIGVDVFATSDLAGAMLNISPEINANACLRDGQVKGIISGDKIRGQRKFQRSFDFSPIAKHIITTNNLPRSNDKSFGFFRRFMIVPFWQTFYTKEEIEALPEPEKKLAKIEDPFIDAKLESERDGIFTWAVIGLERLLKNRAFTKSAQIDEMNRLFQIRSRSVEEWAEERLDTTDVTQNVMVQVAYRDYISFCKKLGVPPVANRRFGNELRNFGSSPFWVGA